MEHCDILIAGGGPAGSALGGRLRASGLDAVIMDKIKFPRHKVCAGWITPAIISALDINIEKYTKENVLQPVMGFRLGRIGQDASREYTWNTPISYGIRRCEFDQYLLHKSGARMYLGTAVEKIVRGKNTWIINDCMETPLLVGAGGHYCPVARHLNPGMHPAAPVIVAQEMEFEMTARQMEQCTVKPEIPELYFCEDFSGYGWIFRKGKFINIGLGREDRNRLPEHATGFLEYLRGSGKLPEGITSQFQGHAYMSYQRSPRRLVADGVILIGDAAGMAYAQSGEGIMPAIESALLAAARIIKARGNYTSENLSGYEAELAWRFGQKHKSSTFTGPVSNWLKRTFAGNLLNNSWFARNIIIEKWFLHARQLPLPIN